MQPKSCLVPCCIKRRRALLCIPGMLLDFKTVFLFTFHRLYRVLAIMDHSTGKYFCDYICIYNKLFFILGDVFCVFYIGYGHVCTSPLMERLGSQVGTGAVACKSSEMIDYFV